MLERSEDWRPEYRLALVREGYTLVKCELAVFNPEVQKKGASPGGELTPMRHLGEGWRCLPRGKRKHHHIWCVCCAWRSDNAQQAMMI